MPVDALVLTVLSSLLFSAGFHGLINIATANSSGLQYKGWRADQVAAIREARRTWLLLPGVAYCLAIITNFGTALVVDSDRSAPRWLGVGLLIVGLFILSGAAIFAILRADRVREGVQLIGSWDGLLEEVQHRLAQPVEARQPGWLAMIETKMTELDSNRAGRDAATTRAAALWVAYVGPRALHWSTPPSRGFLSYRDSQGHRVKVSARLLRRWAPIRLIAHAVSTTLLVTAWWTIHPQWGGGVDIDTALDVAMTVFLLLGFFLYAVAQRSRLIYAVRREWRAEEQEARARAAFEHALSEVRSDGVHAVPEPPYLARLIREVKRAIRS